MSQTRFTFGSRKRRLFPRTLAECVDPAIKPSLKRHGYAHGRILRDWQHIAGTELAAICEPVKLVFPKEKNNEGTLTIKVGSGAAALELQHQIPLLIEKLAVYFGYRAVEKVILKQGVLRLKTQIEKSRPALQVASGAALPPFSVDVQEAEVKEALTNLALAMRGTNE